MFRRRDPGPTRHTTPAEDAAFKAALAEDAAAERERARPARQTEKFRKPRRVKLGGKREADLFVLILAACVFGPAIVLGLVAGLPGGEIVAGWWTDLGEAITGVFGSGG